MKENSTQIPENDEPSAAADDLDCVSDRDATPVKFEAEIVAASSETATAVDDSENEHLVPSPPAINSNVSS